jgi:predicted dehydrogenase
MTAEARSVEARPLKVAVIGAGGWGRQHARVFSGRADVELCAVVARHEERARARAAEWGTRAYTSIAEMIERERPDLISLSLPNESHFEPTLEVIEAGVPLLAEKPLVFDLAQADRLLSAAAERDLFFAINFNHRYAEPVRRARAAVEAGELGEVVFATWRFGGEPGASAGVYTTLAVALEFAGGAVGTLVGSYDSSYAYPSTHLVEVNGTEGRVLIEDTVKRLTLSRRGEETHQVWEAGYFNDFDREIHRTFDKHVDVLLAALRAGKPPPIHARAGRRALELAEAIIASFERGERVAVPPPA